MSAKAASSTGGDEPGEAAQDNEAMGRPAAGRTPRCIVLAPTRELANQVEREFAASAPSLAVGCFYGGARPRAAARGRLVRRMRQGCACGSSAPCACANVTVGASGAGCHCPLIDLGGVWLKGGGQGLLRICVTTLLGGSTWDQAGGRWLGRWRSSDCRPRVGTGVAGARVAARARRQAPAQRWA